MGADIFAATEGEANIGVDIRVRAGDLRKVMVETEAARASCEEGAGVPTCISPGADLRGRPGPLLTGEPGAGAGVEDGTGGYLRGRPGPRLKGAACIVDWDCEVIAGSRGCTYGYLRGRPGPRRGGVS